MGFLAFLVPKLWPKRQSDEENSSKSPSKFHKNLEIFLHDFSEGLNQDLQ